jgi:hypothetical protein
MHNARRAARFNVSARNCGRRAVLRSFLPTFSLISRGLSKHSSYEHAENRYEILGGIRTPLPAKSGSLEFRDIVI